MFWHSFTQFICVLVVSTGIVTSSCQASDSPPWDAELNSCTSEQDFVDKLEHHGYLKEQKNCCGQWIDETVVRNAMHRGWFDATLKIIEACAHVDKKIDAGVHQAASKLRTRISEVTHLLQTAKQKTQAIPPAFQWAQSPDSVFISVKFAHKLDAPACIDLVEDKLSITTNSVTMEYTCKGKNKMYQLDITLLHEIDPEASTWSMASVGRGTLTLKKVSNQKWNRLLKNKNDKPRNMHVWWAMQERYESEMADLEQEQSKPVKSDATTDSSSSSKEESNKVETEAAVAKENDISPEEAEKKRQIKLANSTHKSEKKKITKQSKKAIKKLDNEHKAKMNELKEKYEKEKADMESEFRKIKKETEDKFLKQLQGAQTRLDEAIKAIETFVPGDGDSIATRFQAMYDSVSSLLFGEQNGDEATDGDSQEAINEKENKPDETLDTAVNQEDFAKEERKEL